MESSEPVIASRDNGKERIRNFALSVFPVASSIWVLIELPAPVVGNSGSIGSYAGPAVRSDLSAQQTEFRRSLGDRTLVALSWPWLTFLLTPVDWTSFQWSVIAGTAFVILSFPGSWVPWNHWIHLGRDDCFPLWCPYSESGRILRYLPLLYATYRIPSSSFLSFARDHQRGGFSVWLSSPFYRVSLYAFGGALKTSLKSADLWVINVQLASCTSVIFRESAGNRFNPLFNFSLQRARRYSSLFPCFPANSSRIISK